MSDDPEKEGNKSFKVQDRRRFTDEGEARSADADAPVAGPESGPEEQQEKEEDAKTPGPGPSQEGPGPMEGLPSINFPTFIISLSTQALMQLGEISDPETGVAQRDIAVAKQTIDIIAMLDDKCRGNLDEHEARLMKEVLYDLRMRYVEAVRQK